MCVGSGSSLDEVRNARRAGRGARRRLGRRRHPPARRRARPDGCATTRSSGSPLASARRRESARPGSTTTTTTRRSPSSRRRCAASSPSRARPKQPLSLHIRDAHADARAILTRGARGRGRRRHPLLHRHARRRAGLRRARLARQPLGHRHVQDARAVREAAAWAPLDRLLVETDCPYLAPSPCAESATSRPSSSTRPRPWPSCAGFDPRTSRGHDAPIAARSFACTKY